MTSLVRLSRFTDGSISMTHSRVSLKAAVFFLRLTPTSQPVTLTLWGTTGSVSLSSGTRQGQSRMVSAARSRGRRSESGWPADCDLRTRASAPTAASSRTGAWIPILIQLRVWRHLTNPPGRIHRTSRQVVASRVARCRPSSTPSNGQPRSVSPLFYSEGRPLPTDAGFRVMADATCASGYRGSRLRRPREGAVFGR